MDETRNVKTPTGTYRSVETRVDSSAGNNTIWFILGGVVVVVAVIAYFAMGSGTLTRTDTPSTGGDVSVTIGGNGGATGQPGNVAPAPDAPSAVEALPPATQPEVAPEPTPAPTPAPEPAPAAPAPVQ